MAATKYQILYRATNPEANVIITNDPSVKTEEVIELYHDQHKIEVGTDMEISEANTEKNEFIFKGNESSNIKYQQLYEFVGTKKVIKRKWIPQQLGYVIRDFSKIRKEITNTNFGAEDGDYSGKYLLFEGDTPENGVVVMRTNPLLDEYPSTGSGSTAGVFKLTGNALAANGQFYTFQEMKDIIINATIAEIDFVNKPMDINLYNVLEGPGESWFEKYLHKTNKGVTLNHYNVNTFIEQPYSLIPKIHTSSSDSPGDKDIYNCVNASTMESSINNGHLGCAGIKLDQSKLKRYMIPAHWEYSIDAPYCIRDSYQKIQQEPWFVYSTRGSFEAAIEEAKELVDKIGLENVKLIKVVPTDQFLKIK